MLESWVEISSQASASSLVSLADASVRPTENRVPRPLVPVRSVTAPPRSSSVAGSSQDEYEESSSESEPVLSSSNEDLTNNAALSDDDDNRTALGTRPNEPFTPQPNAFSHPPNTRPSQGSYFPHVASAPSSHIHNRPSRSRPYLQRERERTGMASSYQHAQDHDAALRASLTTLLSCAAAVRPKPQHSLSTSSGDKDKPVTTTDRPVLTRPSNQPTMMRLVPESQLNARKSSTGPSKSSPKRRSRSRSNSKDRLSKKAKPQQNKMSSEAGYSYDDYLISPTVASWMISAGMVLVFSAISFSAGYAWGREVGRIEGEMGLTGGGGSCSKEALRSSGGVRGWGRASVVS